MYDEFYYDSDEGMSIERISEAEQNEFNDIEGIEVDAESSGQEVFDPSGAEDVPVLSEEVRSTPENPLYDPETGQRIPNGYTMRDWEKRKEAVAKKQAEIKARIERERKAFEEEQLRQKQLDNEAEYIKSQKENEVEAHEQLSEVLAGHGQDNIITDGDVENVKDETLSGVVTEINSFNDMSVPEKWQNQFDYSIDKQTSTITLEHYNGESRVVTVPSVAYDDDGTALNVVISEEKEVFSLDNTSYIGISSEIPVENFSDFFQRATGKEYHEASPHDKPAKAPDMPVNTAFESEHDPLHEKSFSQETVIETPFDYRAEYRNISSDVNAPEYESRFVDESVHRVTNVPDTSADTHNKTSSENDASKGSVQSLEDEIYSHPSEKKDVGYTADTADELTKDDAREDAELQFLDTRDTKVSKEQQPEGPVFTKTEMMGKPGTFQDLSMDNSLSDDGRSNIVSESIRNRSEASDNALAGNVSGLEDNPVIRPADVSSVSTTSHLSDDSISNVTQKKTETKEQYVSHERMIDAPVNNALSDDGRSNIVNESIGNMHRAEHSENNSASKLAQLNQINTTRAFQIADAANDGRADTSENMSAERKAQLNDTFVSRADSVIMTNASALDSKTGGSYGMPQNSDMANMLKNQSNMNDIMGSDIGVTGKVSSASKKDAVIRVAGVEDAGQAEQGNYKEEKEKKSDARGYDKSTEQSIIKALMDEKGIKGDPTRFGGGMAKQTGPTPTEAEDSTEVYARQSEKEAKLKIKSYQTVKDGLEGLGNVIVQNIAHASDSEENDAAKGFQQVKGLVTDARVLMGTNGLFAAASLDASMGARQSKLMSLAVENDIDMKKLSVLAADFSNKKESLESFKSTMKNAGMNDADAKKAALKAYKESKEDFISALQEKGLTKREALDLVKKGLDGKTIAEHLSEASNAQQTLLNFADKNKGVFTDEELNFIKSKKFFDGGNHSVEISKVMTKYFDKSGNDYLKKFNPAREYTNMLESRVTGKSLSPVKGGRTLGEKAGKIIDPHSYNIRPNLSTAELDLVNMKRLDKAIKADSKAFTDEQRAMLGFSKKTIKRGRDVEKKKAFNKNKFSFKNLAHVSAHFFQKLDGDASTGFRQVMAIKRGAEATYSVLRILGKSGRLTAKGLTFPIRYIARKTGFTAAFTRYVDNKKAILSSAIKAKKSTLKSKALNSKAGKGLNTVKTQLSTSRPVVGVKTRVETAKRFKTETKKKVKKVSRRIETSKAGTVGSAIGRFIGAPFKAMGYLAKGLNKLKLFFATVGKWILIGVAVIILVWLFLLFLAGLMQSFGKTIDITGRYVIMADGGKVEEWVAKYLELDNKKYEEAVSHAEDDPINPYVWGGVRLYHYGVYEPTYTAYFNRSNANCFYHESGKTKKRDATNGFHIIYIDKDGNTLGSNTTNVKDVLSLTTALIGNDWMTYTSESEMLQDQIYTALNPSAVYVESEIYACSQGCDTFPQKYIDGDSANGLNWYSSSAYKAYECDDVTLYAEYNRLKAAGVKFFNDETYEYMSKTYYERLVPQTSDGCNVKASFRFKRVKVQDSYYENYITLPSGMEIPDYSSYVPAVYEYQLDDVEYDRSCGGQTYVYTYDSDGYYYRSTRTSPYAYGSLYYTDDEHISAVRGAGFYGYYSRDYSASIPHTAIKCCYGHKDLNVYITVLTKEDVIEAKGQQIEYKVPVRYSHETGEVTEWKTKKTMSIVSFINFNPNLRTLSKVFFDKDGFDGEENVDIINGLYDEDWYDLYGVNVYEGAAIPDTLSRESTVTRLNYALLGDVSELRNTLVTTAYSQVGRIPYYWGGKAISTDIYANHFGTTVPADSKGRTKKGLDCSGFVQLMFCIASGADLNSVGNSTGTFVPSLGLPRISYSDLQPGDIGMENLPGATSNHIGIYAGGGMWIHCSGSPRNTVVYDNSNCFRYYYSLGR